MLVSHYVVDFFGGGAPPGVWESLTQVAASRYSCLLLSYLAGLALFFAARRVGLTSWPAAVLACLLMLSPFVGGFLATDRAGVGGLFIVLAYWALQSGRRGWGVVALFLVGGTYPLALPAVVVWSVVEWRQAVGERKRGSLFKYASLGFAVQLVLAFLLLAGWLLADSQGSTPSESGGFPLLGILVNAVGLLLLFASYGFLPLLRSRWLVLLIPDFAYYLLAGMHHGIISFTSGVLAIAAVEGMTVVQRGEARGRLQRGLAKLLRPKNEERGHRRFSGPTAFASVLVALVVVNALTGSANVFSRLLTPLRWDAAWKEDVERLREDIPERTEVCIVQRTLLALFQGHCQHTYVMEECAPFYGAEVRVGAGSVEPRDCQLGRPGTVLALQTDLFDETKYEHRAVMPDPQAALRTTRALVDSGVVSAVARQGGAYLFAPTPSDRSGLPVEWPPLRPVRSRPR